MKLYRAEDVDKLVDAANRYIDTEHVDDDPQLAYELFRDAMFRFSYAVKPIEIDEEQYSRMMNQLFEDQRELARLNEVIEGEK